MTQTIEKKSRLPKIVDVKLKNFDLYKIESSFEVSTRKSVNCLIGANGLGKSTFLNAVLFGITGCIPSSSRKFMSADEYYRSVSKFDLISDYFEGRISEGMRDHAAVGVTLDFGSSLIYVERAFFAEESINELKVCKNGETWEVLDAHDYSETIVKETRLTYPLFVFLLHYVSLFDEKRHLLMWDDAALTSALFIAFGSNAEFAESYEALSRKFDKLDSKARNARYAAQQQEKRLEELNKALLPAAEVDKVKTERVSKKLDELSAESDALNDRLLKKETELKDVELKWFDLNSDLSELELEYKNLFNERLKKNSRISFHPTVSNSIDDDQCMVCGTPNASEKIQEKLKHSQCPLCDSPIEEDKDKDKELLESLKDIDLKIGRIRTERDSIFETRKRLNEEVADTRKRFLKVEDEYNKFKNDNSDYVDALTHSKNLEGSAIQEKIRTIRADREAFSEESAKFYKQRDEVRKEIKPFEKSLKESYEKGAEFFVPRFRELAESFIGLPIDIELEQKQGRTKVGFGLKLRMQGQLRLSPERLSESQRFFIDIALRMSLLEILSETPTSMIVDTPEGSLDIAYEARAGDMFSKFTENQNSILMTANLRSSALVVRLAEKKKIQGMKVIKMTEWTDLSEVQRTEEQLFTKAYEEIDKALR